MGGGVYGTFLVMAGRDDCWRPGRWSGFGQSDPANNYNQGLFKNIKLNYELLKRKR
jgi:hypothetical protein